LSILLPSRRVKWAIKSSDGNDDGAMLWSMELQSFSPSTDPLNQRRDQRLDQSDWFIWSHDFNIGLMNSWNFDNKYSNRISSRRIKFLTEFSSRQQQNRIISARFWFSAAIYK
jgi:hypothetical protein